MVVHAVHQREAVGDRVQACSLRAGGSIRADVGAVHDLRQPLQAGILQRVLDHDRLEAAAPVDVAELDVLDVVGCGALSRRDGHDLIRGHVQEFSVLVDESLDEPWACDAIDIGVLARDPLHSATS